MLDGPTENLEQRVLLMTPTARDTAVSRDILARAGIVGQPCASITELCREAARGVGAALITAEAVLGDREGRLAGFLKSQPPWSDLPLIVVTPSEADSARMLQSLESIGPMSLVKRPVQLSTIVSLVRVALRDRNRQYAVRDMLIERQRNAEILRAEREQYRVTLASIGDGVIATDTKGRVTFLNKIAEHLTGWKAEDALGRALEEIFRIVDETTRQTVANPIHRALVEGMIVGLANHTILIARDGTEWPLDDSAAPIRDADGVVAGAVLVFREISERKAAAAELAKITEESDRLRRLYETVLSATPDFVYVFSLDHRVLYANDALIEMWGRGRDVVGKSFLELGYEPWHAEMHDREIDVVRVTRMPIRGEVPFNGTFGRRNYDYIFVPVFGPYGEVEAVVGTTRDVTERKSEEERLRLLDILNEAVRAAADPEEAMATTSRLLGEHFGASRVAYADVDTDNDGFVIRHDWTAPGIESSVGSYSLDSFGPRAAVEMRAGRTLVVRDVSVELAGVGAEAFESLGIKSIVCRPLSNAGRLVAMMAVHHATARNWSVLDVALVEEVVERSWAHIERARSAMELRESQERVRLATDAAGLAVWVWEPSLDRVTWENDRPYEMFGINRSEPPLTAARFMAEFLHPDDSVAFLRAMSESITAGKPYRFCGRFRRLNGEIRWIELSGRVQPSVEGRVERIVGVAADVTDRMRAEEQERRVAEEALVAAEANAKFRTFFEQGSNFAGVMTPDGTVVEANRICLEACGYRREDVIGKRFWDCGWWRPSPSIAETMREGTQAAASGRTFRTETTYYLADGTERVVDLVIAPVTDDSGRVLFIAPTGNDVTERKRAEEALREADRKKDDFIALLAHELRNPLAPIRNGLQVLQLSQDPTKRERSQQMMSRQLTHMVRLIDDLLDVSRIGRQKMELRRSRVSLADVIASAVETARPAIEEAEHDLTIELPKTPVFLDADLTRLSQVFSNLLTNSAKYTETGGRIWLMAETQDDAVLVSVRDTGTGIPAVALPTIFDMFSQGDRLMERRSGGLGIGLALVKGLVEMHGGAVAVTSEGQGCGSTFTVSLPILVERPKAPETPVYRGPDSLPKSRRILVVDDYRDGAESLATMLELIGNEVAMAYDGFEAIERAAELRPEIVLMDVGMPGLDGLEATKRIREKEWGRSMTIIALTGWGQEADRERSRQAGCDGHLVKPVNLPDLENLMTELHAGRM